MVARSIWSNPPSSETPHEAREILFTHYIDSCIECIRSITAGISCDVEPKQLLIHARRIVLAAFEDRALPEDVSFWLVGELDSLIKASWRGRLGPLPPVGAETRLQRILETFLRHYAPPPAPSHNLN